MKKFLYVCDTPCHVDLMIKKELKEVSLYKNQVYELPSSEPFIKSLVAQGKLKQNKK